MASNSNFVNKPDPISHTYTEEDQAADEALLAQMGFGTFGQQKRKTDAPQSDPVLTSTTSPVSPRRQHRSKRQKRAAPVASGANLTALSIRRSPAPEPEARAHQGATQGSFTRGNPDTVVTSIETEDGSPGHDDEVIHTMPPTPRLKTLPLPQQPPTTQRLPNGDTAFFRPSFITDDPWAGMVPVKLQ